MVPVVRAKIPHDVKCKVNIISFFAPNSIHKNWPFDQKSGSKIGSKNKYLHPSV